MTRLVTFLKQKVVLLLDNLYILTRTRNINIISNLKYIHVLIDWHTDINV